MTAGSGIIHEEFHEDKRSQVGGVFQMVQLWVNLPSKYKMTKPGYQALKHQDIPKYVFDHQKSFIEVIAGEYQGLKGIAHTFSPLHVMNVSIFSGEKIEFSFPQEYTTLLLVLQGKVVVNRDTFVSVHNLAIFAYE